MYTFDPHTSAGVPLFVYHNHSRLINPGVRTMLLRSDGNLGGFFGDVGRFFKKTVQKLPQMAVGAATGYVTSGGDWHGAAAGAVAARTRKGKWLKFKVLPHAVVPGAIAGGVVGVGKLAYGAATGGVEGAMSTPLGSALGKTGEILKGAWSKTTEVVTGTPETAGGVPQPGVEPGQVITAATKSGTPNILSRAGSTVVDFVKATGDFVISNPDLVLGIGGAILAGSQKAPPAPMPGDGGDDELTGSQNPNDYTYTVADVPVHAGGAPYYYDPGVYAPGSVVEAGAPMMGAEMFGAPGAFGGGFADILEESAPAQMLKQTGLIKGPAAPWLIGGGAIGVGLLVWYLWR